jgi:DNA-directed RNA polymerase subunit RPC12/RpoP
MSEFDEEQLAALTPEKGEESREEAEAVLYTCPSCGAQIVTDDTTAASICYYCHNPVVLSGKLEGEYKPDYVIPFQIDRKKAEEIFSQWIGRKRYVPTEFYNKRQIETMSGIYFPYWLYGCHISGDFQARGTKIRTWDTGGLRYTETKTYDISRKGEMDVDNVARNALRKANRRLVDNVLPYRMEAKKEFGLGYLSGFMAENRDMEKQEFTGEVQDEVKNYASSSLESQASGYANLQVMTKDVRVSDEKWSSALLPVWTLTYKDKKDGKIYYFALNGQTGKAAGALPVDQKKLAVLFLTVFLPLFVLLLIGGYLI